MTIEIRLKDNRDFECSNNVIGKTFENKATILKFYLTEEMLTKDFYIEFEKADATKFVTPKLEIISEEKNNAVSYEIPNSLLDLKGELKTEVVLRNNDEVWKSYAIKFNILDSINASEEMATQYPDFVSEAQKVIDLIETEGDGSKFLADDGTYKSGGSGGTTDYDKLTNKPISYLTGTDKTAIYFNELGTGKYILNGKAQPYKDADITIYADNLFVEVQTSDSEVDVLYNNPSTNAREHYKMLIDASNYTHTSILYSELKQKETIVTNSRTLVSTTIQDNQSYQISSNPSRITISFPSEREPGFRCWLVFKTDDSLPTFTCNYDIKWHGDSVSDNTFTMNANKSYTIEFWQDVNYFNAEVREV